MPMRHEALGDRRAGHAEQVDGLDLGRVDPARAARRPVAASRRGRGRRGRPRSRAPARTAPPACEVSPPPAVAQHVALEVLDELAHQLRRHVDEHAPPELRDLAGDRQVGRDVDLRAARPRASSSRRSSPWRCPARACRGPTRRSRCGGSPRRPRPGVAVPLYCAVIGPTFTFTMPRYSSPSTSCSCAPGRHGAMPSMSSITFHVASIGVLTRKLSCDLHRDSNSARSAGVSTSAGAPVPSHGTATAGWRRKSTRAPSSPASSIASGQYVAADQHRDCPARRRRWRTRGRAPSSYAPATRRYASAPTSGWSASRPRPPRPSAIAVRGGAARTAGSTRCPRSGASLRTISTPRAPRPRARPGRRRRRARPAHSRSRAPRRARTRAAGGRAAACSDLGVSPPKRTPRPAASTTAGSRRAQIASSARRTSTCARWARYSGDAFRSAGGSVPTAASRAASAARRALARARSRPRSRAAASSPC